MTVSAANPPFNEYTAAPGAVVFPYTFKVIKSDDMKVLVNGAVKVIGVDYTLSGVGANNGGDVTFLAPMAGGENVVARMDLVFDRQTDYQQNGDFLSPTVNGDYDRIWLAIQQIGQSLKAAIKLPFTTTAEQSITQSPSERANTVLAFDASGNIITSTTDAQNVIAAQAAAAAAQAAAASIDPSNLVHRTGNETIGGTKTFTDPPIFPASVTESYKWLSKAIGELYLVNDAMAGADVPPTNNPAFRYIKLTASDSYNSGVVISESSSGSAPLVVSTGVISLAGSPLNGRTVNMINTERRVLRAGSAGTLENDAMQGHVHTVSESGPAATNATSPGGAYIAYSGFAPRNSSVPASDGTSGTPRTATETRVKSIGMTAYMRVK